MSHRNHDLPGFLISFEGSEGSGKSTQISRIATLLEDAGQPVIVTREPGGTDIGEEIRHLLKHSGANSAMFSETELLLFAAARAQLVREVILPAMQDGKIILSDRFLDSTTVYQGVARQISEDPIKMINDFAVGSIVPDLTVILDVPAEVGLKRCRTRASDLPDRMETENIEFYKRVREGYLLLAQSMPERYHVIDGDRDPMDVEADIWDAVSQVVLDGDE
ncbi:MAG: dTMP kinase [Verrucomicrobiota bacterium]